MATIKLEEQVMKDTVRIFAIDYQDWASQQNLSYSEIAQVTEAIEALAEIVDPGGELAEELKENGIL